MRGVYHLRATISTASARTLLATIGAEKQLHFGLCLQTDWLGTTAPSLESGPRLRVASVIGLHALSSARVIPHAPSTLASGMRHAALPMFTYIIGNARARDGLTQPDAGACEFLACLRQ